eukprot:3842146-Prymnesium_polylepis.1
MPYKRSIDAVQTLNRCRANAQSMPYKRSVDVVLHGRAERERRDRHRKLLPSRLSERARAEHQLAAEALHRAEWRARTTTSNRLSAVGQACTRRDAGVVRGARCRCGARRGAGV